MRHRRTRRQDVGWRAAIAAVAIHLLVVQALLTGLTLAAHASPFATDAFGGTICSPEGIRPGPDGPSVPSDAHLAGCCPFGCCAVGPVLTPPPGVALLVPAPTAEIVVRGQDYRGARTVAPERTLGSPRAPPIA